MKKFLCCALLLFAVQLPAAASAGRADSESDRAALLGSGLHMGENQPDAYWFEKGEKYFADARFADAIEAYTKAVGANGQFTEAYFKRGEAKLGLKNYAAAKEDYNQAVDLDAAYAQAYFKRAVCSYYLGDYAAADGDCAAAISLEPRHGGAYLIKAVCQQKLGNTDKAIAACQELLRQAPEGQEQILQAAEKMLRHLGANPKETKKS